MTTYRYTLSIGDSEFIALDAALKLMIEHCEAQLAAGHDAPYWARKHHCSKMLEKLRAAVSTSEMTSTSSFCLPQRPEDE
ncbi:hypothetical protein [Bradyrhizobium quebecense]|uniref:Uncharacterized protein n=2 Tax=Bradyrhizobium quebecense TaxID=2748629 RepID=A0ABS3MED2_9BRAD|nr:hypothetical protein [Bradyrhizobium quebecense]UGY05082.1 hypothetical protein J4P68_0010245 [Bradyrhizobium quebecense]